MNTSQTQREDNLTRGGKYPIDGDLANSKRKRAEWIVDALNKEHLRTGEMP